MKCSQYLESYKAHYYQEAQKGEKPYSLGTYLMHSLKGNAKYWVCRYKYSLINGLEKDGWHPCKSKLGGIAYEPADNKD